MQYCGNKAKGDFRAAPGEPQGLEATAAPKPNPAHTTARSEVPHGVAAPPLQHAFSQQLLLAHTRSRKVHASKYTKWVSSLPFPWENSPVTETSSATCFTPFPVAQSHFSSNSWLALCTSHSNRLFLVPFHIGNRCHLFLTLCDTHTVVVCLCSLLLL